MSNYKKYTSNDVLSGFFDSIGDSKLWPPLNNYSLFVFGSGYNSKKYFNSTVYNNIGKYELLTISDGINSTVNIPENPLINSSEEVFIKYLCDPKKIQIIEKNFYANFLIVDALYARYTYKKITTDRIDELYDILGKAFDLIWSSNAWSHFSAYFDKEMCWKIISKQKLQITKEELDDIWDRATVPVFHSFDQEQEQVVLKFLAKGRSRDSIAESCQYFYTNYKDARPIQEVRKRLRKQYGCIKNAKYAKKELAAFKRNENSRMRQYVAWKKQLTPMQQKVANYCQIVMRVRDHRKNFFAKGLTVGWRIAERILSEAGLDKKLLEFTLPFQELMKGVKFVRSQKNEIKKRQKGYVAWVRYNGGVQIAYDRISDAKAKVSEYYLRPHANKPANEVSGQVGNKGFARGIARIILDINKSDHFKRGDILVTGMTMPEYVPLMKKAAAIVTDEGGITCHAAIVSRELNKPCIIGVKIATKVLKDGDLIEVDAEKGVVKVIKKS